LVEAKFENDSPQEAESLLASVFSVLTFWSKHSAKLKKKLMNTLNTAVTAQRRYDSFLGGNCHGSLRMKDISIVFISIYL